MRGTKLFVLAAAIAWLVPAAGSARGDDPPQSPDEKPFPDQPPSVLQEPLRQPGISGPIVPDEDLWTAHLSDEPQAKATAAVEAMKAGDLKRARENLLKLASHVYLAADRSDGHARAMLIASLEELKRTANAVSQGALPSSDALIPPLARALQALAYHHAIKASEHWLNKKEISAGYDLQAAEQDFRDALAWIGRTPDTDLARLLNDAHALSVRLIREEAIGTPEVTGAVTGLTEKADELGDFLRTTS